MLALGLPRGKTGLQLLAILAYTESVLHPTVIMRHEEEKQYFKITVLDRLIVHIAANHI